MTRWLFVAVFFIAGAACFWGATVGMRVTLPLVTRGRLAVGVITSYEQGESSDSETQPALYAVIHFNTPARQTHSFRSNGGLPQEGIGQHVEVIYDPEQPSRARVNSFRALWLGPALAVGMGLLCFGGLVMVMWWLPSSTQWTSRLPGDT